MNEEEKDQKPEGREQDFSEFANQQRPQPDNKRSEGGGDWILRGCGIVLGVVVLVFFLVLGVCFIPRW